VDELTTTEGITALAAGGVALLALLLALGLWIKLRRLQRAQRAVLGDDGAHDLVSHAAELQSEFGLLRETMEETAAALHQRMHDAESRLDGTIAYRSLVRYDAYNEMSGRQSMSIALLDASRSGVVLSSIHHRDHARLYAKQVRNGEGELELSPEESRAVALALGDEAPERAPSRDAASASG
jgi:hypothetical protein